MFVCFVTIDEVFANDAVFSGQIVVRVESLERDVWENASVHCVDLLAECGLECNSLTPQQEAQVLDFVYDSLEKRAGDIPARELMVSWPADRIL